jgi:GNAT superfamily N-acetyltransferase
MLRVMDEALDSPEAESEMPKRITHWQDRIDCDRCIILVARYDNEIIGWARGGALIECHKIDGVHNACEIQNLFVRKRWQKKSVGSQLWKSIWQAVVGTYKPNNMMVWSTEQARGFYARFGGTEVMKKQFDPEAIHFSYAFVWQL